MIPITPVASPTILLDVDEVAFIEHGPRSVVVLENGRRITVTESADELARTITTERAARLAGAAGMHRSAPDNVVPFPGVSPESEPEP